MTGVALPALVACTVACGSIACAMTHAVLWPTRAASNVTLVTLEAQVKITDTASIAITCAMSVTDSVA